MYIVEYTQIQVCSASRSQCCDILKEAIPGQLGKMRRKVTVRETRKETLGGAETHMSYITPNVSWQTFRSYEQSINGNNSDVCDIFSSVPVGGVSYVLSYSNMVRKARGFYF